MTAMVARGAVLGLAALVAGCASNGTTMGTGASAAYGAEVTRFHLGQNIARGEIAIEPLDRAQMGSMDFGRAAAAVERELAALGWSVVRGNTRSEQVAVVRVQQGAPGARGGAMTELSVRLQRRSDGTAIWEGRAQSGARATPADPGAAVDRLARALFQGFPGESGRTIRVP
jgi:hypothetical protein